MKKIVSLMFLLFCVVVLNAQSTQTWFDGNAYYTSKLTDDGILFFQGTSASKEPCSVTVPSYLSTGLSSY